MHSRYVVPDQASAAALIFPLKFSRSEVIAFTMSLGVGVNACAYDRVSDGEWCLGEEWCLDSNSGHAALFIDASGGQLPIGAREWQLYDPETEGWAAAVVTATIPGKLASGNVAAAPATTPAAAPAPALAPAADAGVVRPLRMTPAQRAAAAAERDAADEAERERGLKEAQAKFNELDEDNSGSLDTSEVGQLAKFVLSSFGAGEAAVTDEKIGTMKEVHCNGPPQ